MKNIMSLVSLKEENGDCVVFVKEPSPHLKCPVCKQCYVDPVINVTCGHTFCRRCADSCRTCPEDGSTCEKSGFVVNKLVVGQVDDLVIYCRYGVTKSSNNGYIVDPSSCQEKITLGTRHEHEDVCKYAPVLCPNGRVRCGEFRKFELDEHLKDCVYFPCKYKMKGCEYANRKQEIKEHEDMCGYRGVSRGMGVDDFSNSLKAMADDNEQLKEQLVGLTKKVSTLEESNKSVLSQLEEGRNTFDILNRKFDRLGSLMEQLLNSNRRPISITETRYRTSSTSSSSSPRHSLSGSPPLTALVEKWEMPFQFKCIGTFRGHKGPVSALTARKHELYSGAADCVLKVWDLQYLYNGCVKTVSTNDVTIQCSITSGDFLYTAGEDLALRIWNIGEWTEHKSCAHSHDTNICAMLLTEDYLFTSSFALIKVWDRKTLELCHTISGLYHWVRGLALSPSKELVYSGSHNTIDIWQASDQFALKGKIDHSFGSIYSLVVTDKFLIAGTYNQNIQIFNHAKQHVLRLKGHIGIVTCLQASRCGQFLFSGSSDQTVRIWNLDNLLPIQTLHRHQNGVTRLLLHNDLLMSGSEDNDIKIYRYFQMYMGQAIE